MAEDVQKDLADVIDIETGVAKDRQFVTSLARGLSVLRVFKPGDQVLGNGEIAERTGLPKPTISRLTHTLTKLGYLTYSERLGKYQLGIPVLSLGYALLSNTELRRVARPHMQRLADYANASVALAGRDRLSMVYVENCQGSMVTLRLDVGSRIPIATTAIGRAFLIALPETEQDYLLEAIKRHSGDDWPKIRDGIEKARRDIETIGCCYSFCEWQSDVNGVGVPFRYGDDANMMAFNCGGPSYQVTRKRIEQDIGPRLIDMVRGLEAELGRSGGGYGDITRI